MKARNKSRLQDENRQADKVLRESEDRLKRIAKATNDTLWDWDLITNVVWWNEGIQTLFGYTEEQVGSDITWWYERIHSEDRERVVSGIHALIDSGGTLWKDEYRYQRADGSFLEIADRGYVYQDDSGKPVRMFGGMVDITERKQAERLLKRTSYELSTIIESTVDGILVIDNQGHVLYANNRFKIMWQIPDALIASKDDAVLLDFVLDQLVDAEGFLTKVRTLYPTATEDRDTLIFKDGRIFERYSCPLIEAGSIAGRLWSFQDITERRRAEQVLVEEQRNLKEAESQGKFGHWEYDLETQIIIWSDEVYALYDRDPSLGPPTVEEEAVYYSPDQTTMLHDYAARTIQTGERCEYDLVANLPGRGKVYFSASMQPVKNDQGKIVKLFGTVQDITERKRVEEILQESFEDTKKHAERLTLLNRIARSLSTTLDLGELLEIIHHEITAQIQAEAFFIALYDQATNELDFRIRVDKGVREPLERRPLGTGLTAQVVSSKQPLLIRDFSREKENLPTIELWGTGEAPKSWLGVPIRLGDRVIGVVAVQAYSPNAYGEAEQELLSTIADTVAVAIENARLYSAEKRRAARLVEISKLGVELATLNEASAVLNILVTRAAAIMESPTCMVYLLDTTKNEAVLTAQTGLPEGFSELHVPLTLPIIRHSVETGEPIIIPDIDHDAPEMRSVLVRPDVQAFFAYPMIREGQTIGFIVFTKLTPYLPSDEEVAACHLLAERAAAALENAHLFGRVQSELVERKRVEGKLQRRVTDLEVLAEAGLTFNQLLDPRAIGQKVIEILAEHLNWHHAAVRQRREGSDEIELLALALPGLDQAEIKVEEARVQSLIKRVGDGASGWVIQHGQTIRSGNVTGDPRYTCTFTDMLSGLYVPMKVGENTIGCISVESHEPNVFDENDERLLITLADQAALAINNARLYEEIEHRLHQTQALRDIDKVINASVDLRLTLTIFLEQVVGQLGADAADVLLYNPHLQVLEYADGRGFLSNTLQHTRLRLGDSYAGRAALERKPIRVSGLKNRKTDLLRSPSFSQEGFDSYYGIPLLAKGQIKGVLEIFHRTPFTPDPDWLNFLEALADQASIALDNAALFDDLQRMNIELAAAYDATIQGWSRALDLRDKETEGHTQRVTEQTLRLARAMGIREEELDDIRYGVLLHDIGKMGVPDTLLLKPGPLTDEEWVIMRKHPQYALDMLAPIAYLRRALDIPYCHHEKWDGSGYPRGFKGEEIPIAARIFSIIDVLDALTSDRPYRKAWTKKKALIYIREQAGLHFDPKVVEAFLSMQNAEIR